MKDDVLVSYFREWTEKGYTVQELKAELIKQGYPVKAIDEAVMEFEKKIPPEISGREKKDDDKGNSIFSSLKRINKKTKKETSKKSSEGKELKEKNIYTKKNSFKEKEHEGGNSSGNKRDKRTLISGIKTGLIAGVLQGIVGSAIGTILTSFIFNEFIVASGGGITGLSGGIASDMVMMAGILNMVTGIIIGAVAGAAIGFIIVYLWETLPGKKTFIKAFAVSFSVMILIGVVPSLFAGELAISLIMLPLVTGTAGALVYSYIFERMFGKGINNIENK